VTRLIKKGRFEGEEEVTLVAIDTDEGFNEFYKQVLEHGNGAVPSAYKDNQRCSIKIADDDILLFECPNGS